MDNDVVDITGFWSWFENEESEKWVEYALILLPFVKRKCPRQTKSGINKQCNKPPDTELANKQTTKL